MYTTLIEVAYLVKEELQLIGKLPTYSTYSSCTYLPKSLKTVIGKTHILGPHTAQLCAFDKFKNQVKIFFHMGNLWLFISRYASYHLRLLYLFSVFQSPSIFQRKFWREKVPFSEFGKVGYYLLMVIPVNLPNSEEGFFVWIITPQIATELGYLKLGAITPN